MHDGTMARCTLAGWQAGTMQAMHAGTMARCRLCTLARWHDGTLARWHTGTLARRHDGTLAHWHDGTMARWHDGTMARWHAGTLARWQAVDASIRVCVAPCMDFRGPKSRLEKVEVGTNTRAILSATCFLQQLQTQCHPCSTWNSVLYSTLCLVLSAIYSPMLSTGLQKTK